MYISVRRDCDRRESRDGSWDAGELGTSGAPGEPLVGTYKDLDPTHLDWKGQGSVSGLLCPVSINHMIVHMVFSS